MTLITCPECHNQVSDLASACPHCGCPVLKINLDTKNTGKQYEDINLMGGYAAERNNTYGSQTYQQNAGSNYNRVYPNAYPNTYSNTYYSNNKTVIKSESTLSTVALWISILFLPFVGLILGIIDKSTDKEGNYTHKGSTFAIIYGSIAIGVSLLLSYYLGWGNRTKAEKKPYIPAQELESYVAQEQPKVETKKNYNIKVANNMNNMSVGEIGEKDGVYVGMSYVKRMSYLPTALDGKEEVSSPDNEVVIGFFEFFNGTEELASVGSYYITCYADGVQVQGIESYIKIYVDEVYQDYGTEIDPETKLVSCQNFEVPKDWKELKFYYESSCVWVVHQDDVGTENFSKHPMFTQKSNKTETAEGKVIYDGDYQVTYNGYSYFTEKNSVWGNTPYIIFKYTIKNTSDEALDCSVMGYRMRAYQNGYYMDGPSYTIDDKIDGYVNIFDVDSVEKGMSATVYVAFETTEDGDLYMVYDDGYLADDTKGYIYANPKETNLTIEVSP